MTYCDMLLFFCYNAGLGGVFLLKQGKAKQHVMSDFSKTPICTDEELHSWMNYYEMPATLINLGTLVTNDAVIRLPTY